MSSYRLGAGRALLFSTEFIFQLGNKTFNWELHMWGFQRGSGKGCETNHTEPSTLIWGHGATCWLWNLHLKEHTLCPLSFYLWKDTSVLSRPLGGRTKVSHAQENPQQSRDDHATFHRLGTDSYVFPPGGDAVRVLGTGVPLYLGVCFCFWGAGGCFQFGNTH